MVFLTILLFSYLQMSQQIQKTTANSKEMISNPRLIPVHGTLNIVRNQNVTLSCHSDSGSPPVRYTLFKHNQKVSTLNRPDLTPSLFNLTINSANDVGEYKCKAENNISSGGKYSNSLNFTLLVFFFTEPVSKPMLSSPTAQAKKGQNVTLSCLSENGSLPITYIFFRGRQSISPPVKMQKREAAVIFLFINSSSDFGPYKCRAENSVHNNTKYSNSFNFTLAEERSHSQPLIISLGLILLLCVIGFALAIPFFIIPSYKAKKFKSTMSPTGFTSTTNAEESEDYVIYAEIEPVKTEEYINFSAIRREDGKEERACATIYSKAIFRD
ncbi:allergin-1 isoform X2 [Falco cherrug]|uniref:allergin-1 isoform X2 n=1 Tax=Falco cherrug TaxID=345164 RepID=UPI00247A3219|nr:allergin-1 isoform X2 [Falco cherrug]XP_055583011.1 allergin-1 isoform X2 [Falco cherrug]XP_055583018.1 allergin-1 isoform X2 [Falco cherrug]